VVYTLPPSAQTIGMQFEFLTTVTITSNSAKGHHRRCNDLPGWCGCAAEQRCGHG
jgi:hypothetical protein